MTYRISFFDVDVSKIISIRKLWDLVLLKSDAGARQPALDALNALNASASPVSESGLIELYMKTHTQRVHMYSVGAPRAPSPPPHPPLTRGARCAGHV